MSVLVTVMVNGDPAQLEAHAAANPDAMRAIADRGVRHGVIAHRFYGSEGRIMAVDEWPDEQSFQTFFEEAAPEIQAVTQAAGVTSEPEVTFWRKLETHDEVGWES
jgi:hypothetical protein